VRIVAAEASWVFRFAKVLNAVCSLRITMAATAARLGLVSGTKKTLSEKTTEADCRTIA
jgi:hypothetical protein